ALGELTPGFALYQRVDHESDDVDLGQCGKPTAVLEEDGRELEVALEPMHDVLDDVLVVVDLEDLAVGSRAGADGRVAGHEDHARAVGECLGEREGVLGQRDRDDPHVLRRANFALLRTTRTRPRNRTLFARDSWHELVEARLLLGDSLRGVFGIGAAVVGLRVLRSELLLELASFAFTILLEGHRLLARET